MGHLQHTVGLLLVLSLPSCAGDLNMQDPRICYIVDGILALYSLIVTGLYIKEKFFSSKPKADKESYFLNRSKEEDHYTSLRKKSEDEYKELPIRDRQRKGDREQIYQGLNRGRDHDTYNTLQMQSTAVGH